MHDEIIIHRLRTFFLLFSGSLCLGVIVELVLTGHTKEAIQWVPFGLCVLGAVAATLAVYTPKQQTIRGLRFIMLLLIVGSVLGVYEHLAANWSFAQETRPTAAIGTLLRATLTGGSPLLAPGALAVAAITAIAATYYHPALRIK